MNKEGIFKNKELNKTIEIRKEYTNEVRLESNLFLYIDGKKYPAVGPIEHWDWYGNYAISYFEDGNSLLLSVGQSIGQNTSKFDRIKE